jgi:hypothetical protein
VHDEVFGTDESGAFQFAAEGGDGLGAVGGVGEQRLMR